MAPDGLLNQSTMTDYIKEHCRVSAVVALPSRTFYSNAEEDLRLGASPKGRGAIPPRTRPCSPTWCQRLVSRATARRVSIEENDLKTMELGYGFFKAAPNAYVSTDARCKILSWNQFDGPKDLARRPALVP